MMRARVPGFFAALPVLGVDGILADVCRNHPPQALSTRKRARCWPWRPGELYAVCKGLAGYATCRGQKRLAYALYVQRHPHIEHGMTIMAANNLLGKISVLIQQTP